jgi:hypothetical protein
MNKSVIITIGIVTGVIGVLIAKKLLYRREAIKAISKETGLPYKEVKVEFINLTRKVKEMKKNGATEDEMASKCASVYNGMIDKAISKAG